MVEPLSTAPSGVYIPTVTIAGGGQNPPWKNPYTKFAEIFVDMDGVCANMMKKARELLRADLAEHGNDFAWQELHEKCPTFYRELEPMPDWHILWSYIVKYNPVMLTAIPSRWSWPNICAQKRDWSAEFIDPNTEVRFGPFAVDKQYHCRRPDQVLIDDMFRNVQQWRDRGGIGIHHTSAADTIKQLQAQGL